MMMNTIILQQFTQHVILVFYIKIRLRIENYLYILHKKTRRISPVSRFYPE